MIELSTKKGAELVRALTMPDIEVGQSISISVVLDRDVVAAFADLTGDISPLHVDEAYGQDCEFDGNVAHGMLLAAYFSTLIGVFLPGRTALLAGLTVDFLQPVLVGSEVTVSVRVDRVRYGESCIDLVLLCFRGGETVAQGRAQVKIREKRA